MLASSRAVLSLTVFFVGGEGEEPHRDFNAALLGTRGGGASLWQQRAEEEDGFGLWIPGARALFLRRGMCGQKKKLV